MTRFTVVVALLAAGLSVTASRAAPSRPAQWRLILVQAGPHGAAGVAVSDVVRSTLPAPASAYGAGIAVPRLGLASTLIFPLTGGPASVSTTKQLGGVHLAVRMFGPGHGVHHLAMTTPRLEPNESIGLLEFVAGGHLLDEHPVRSSVDRGLIRVRAVSGSGTGLWSLADPHDQGVGSSAGTIGVGADVSHQLHSAAGLVGGFVDMREVTYQQMTWQSPDHRRGVCTDLTADTGTEKGSPTFAGPAGSWMLDWRGAFADDQPPLLAAWANVGRYWHLFDSRAKS